MAANEKCSQKEWIEWRERMEIDKWRQKLKRKYTKHRNERHMLGEAKEEKENNGKVKEEEEESGKRTKENEDGRGEHASPQPTHQEQLGDQCLAQGHFDTKTEAAWGSTRPNQEPSVSQPAALPSVPLPTPGKRTEEAEHGRGNHARHQSAPQEQLEVQCLAQGHFDTDNGAARVRIYVRTQQSPTAQVAARPPGPLPPPRKRTEEEEHGRGDHASHQSAPREQLQVQCLAQGHFGTDTGAARGSNQEPSTSQAAAQPPGPLPHPEKRMEEEEHGRGDQDGGQGAKVEEEESEKGNKREEEVERGDEEAKEEDDESGLIDLEGEEKEVGGEEVKEKEKEEESGNMKEEEEKKEENAGEEVREEGEESGKKEEAEGVKENNGGEEVKEEESESGKREKEEQQEKEEGGVEQANKEEEESGIKKEEEKEGGGKEAKEEEEKSWDENKEKVVSENGNKEEQGKEKEEEDMEFAIIACDNKEPQHNQHDGQQRREEHAAPQKQNDTEVNHSVGSVNDLEELWLEQQREAKMEKEELNVEKLNEDARVMSDLNEPNLSQDDEEQGARGQMELGNQKAVETECRELRANGNSDTGSLTQRHRISQRDRERREEEFKDEVNELTDNENIDSHPLSNENSITGAQKAILLIVLLLFIIIIITYRT